MTSRSTHPDACYLEPHVLGDALRIHNFLCVASLLLTLPAAAQPAAGDFLTGWQQKVGQQVQLSECYVNSATAGQMYCDSKTQGTRLYIDTQTLDPGSKSKFLTDCAGYNMVPKCRVILSGTLKASFGSPLLANGRATFLLPDGAEQTQRRGGDVGLRTGQYACVGSGGAILAGLGFIVGSTGSYTDLDKTTSGRYIVSGDQVVFQGGHLDGQTGRGLSSKGAFVLGRMVSCEPW